MSPPGALTWATAAERNRKLKLWRRAVCIAFGEQPRCIRVGWTLADLFNAKLGYCFGSNTLLAKETGLTPRNVQKALAALETDSAIVRTTIVRDSGQRWRVIYPATSILDVGGTSTVDVGGDVHQVDVHRLPRSELERARLAARIRAQKAEPEPAAPPQGHPSDGAPCETVPYTAPEPAAAKRAYNGRGARARYPLPQKQ